MSRKNNGMKNMNWFKSLIVAGAVQALAILPGHAGANLDDIKGFGDLSGKKAAQSLTSNYGKIAEQAGAQLVGTDGFDQSIALVVQGRADATVNDSLSFLDFKKKRPDAPVKIAATQDDAAYSGVIVRKDEPELVEAINQALEEIKADGTYQRISEKYFGADVSK